MNKNEYFRRIGAAETAISPNLDSLRLLQKKHLLAVPFENLDIHWNKEILLDSGKFYEKIVENRRGGFCYELNGLFFGLLNRIGFESKIISARVSDGNGGFGPEFDHLAIVSRVKGEEYLVDVGFGDFSAEPLKIVPDAEQIDQNGTFSIKEAEDDYLEVVKITGSGLKSEYIFRNSAHELGEFADMCRFHQTSAESHFTRGKLCSLMTENGRKTLTEKSFIKTSNGRKEEFPVDSESSFYEILKAEFRIAR